MMKAFAALICGLIFGAGLIVSEMVNPRRVQGFLDIAGNWDPTLVFVMLGALVTASIGYRVVLRRSAPLLATGFSLPASSVIDKRLITGALLFGIGWGLSGLCPGPALVGVATLQQDVVLFVVSMTVGMMLFGLVPEKS